MTHLNQNNSKAKQPLMDRIDTSDQHAVNRRHSLLALGEVIAISILRDEKLTFHENFSSFSFTKFDGTKVTI